jgi:hypothetical protein
MVAIFPCQPSPPRRGFDVFWNNVEDRPPRLLRLRPEAGMVERSRFFEKGFPLRRECVRPVQMRQRVLKILAGARNARREQVRGRVVGALCQAALDVTARGLNLALGKQYSGQEMAEHGVAGRADQTLFAQLKRLVAPAGVEGGCRAANDVLGGFFHAADIRTKQQGRNPPCTDAYFTSPLVGEVGSHRQMRSG